MTFREGTKLGNQGNQEFKHIDASYSEADQKILSAVLINYLRIREEWVEEIERN